MIDEFSLKNSGDWPQEFPDIIDKKFDISNAAYLINVLPDTPFWRFGIRFSELEEINFNRSFEGYEWYSSIYKDVYFSAGIKTGSEWLRSDQLNVNQNNFELPEKRINYQNTYKKYGKLEIFLKFIPKSNEVLE